MKLRRELSHELIVGLDAKCFPADARVEPLDSIWWTVWTGGEAVAFAGLRVCQDPANRGVGFLSRAGVLPVHRGRGLQKRLIRCRLNEARRLGLLEVVTYVLPSNLPSANSLIGLGFKLYRPTSRWGGVEALYFRRAL
jgi:GNAT superfamily N-acetyltransferase